MNMAAEHTLCHLAIYADSSSESNDTRLFVAGSVLFLSSPPCPVAPTTVKVVRISASETCHWRMAFVLSSCLDMRNTAWVSFVGTIASSSVLRVVRTMAEDPNEFPDAQIQIRPNMTTAVVIRIASP